MFYPQRECPICHLMFYPKSSNQRVCRAIGRDCLKRHKRNLSAASTRRSRERKALKEQEERMEAYKVIPTEPSQIVSGRRMF